jgi:hypothetical protein
MAAHRDDTPGGTKVTGATPALELAWLEERSDREQASVAVALRFGGRVVTGLSPSVGIKRRRHGVHRAVLATLDAIEQLSLRRVACELVDVGRTRAGDGTWVRVRLILSFDGRVAEVHGRARVRDGAADAAARAVLDAVSELVAVIASLAG